MTVCVILLFLTLLRLGLHFVSVVYPDHTHLRFNIPRGPLGPESLTLMIDQWSGIICKILVECTMRNNSVKLY